MDPFSTWKEIQDVQFAILPIGSLEQHGDHLPIGTDGMIASAIAKKVSHKFPSSFLLPLLPFSSSYEHAEFKGSISLRVPTIYYMIQDIFESLTHQGINRCILINGHGGNHLLRNIAQEFNQDAPHILLAPSKKHWQKAYEQAQLTSTISQDMHAGEGETSLLLHLFSEDVVRKQQIQDVHVPNRPLLETIGMKPYTKTGVIGFPSQATKEKGKQLLDELITQITITVKEFLSCP